VSSQAEAKRDAGLRRRPWGAVVSACETVSREASMASKRVRAACRKNALCALRRRGPGYLGQSRGVQVATGWLRRHAALPTGGGGARR
jgi:hypothetical protein